MINTTETLQSRREKLRAFLWETAARYTYRSEGLNGVNDMWCGYYLGQFDSILNQLHWLEDPIVKHGSYLTLAIYRQPGTVPYPRELFHPEFSYDDPFELKWCAN